MPHTDDPAPHEVRLAGALTSLDRTTQFVERPVRRLSGPDRLNPVVHAGTISVFLLAIVIVTGLYITLFFEFGFAASYDSVAAMEDHVVQRLMRAIHRYSSAALVLTTVVHAWKMFTTQRFIGHRRRWRWTTGIAALTLVWLAGVTGYWLVWDRRAAAISEAVAKLVQPTGFGSRFAVRNLIGVSPGSGSGILLTIWFAHIAITMLIAWFMFRHLRRSKQPWLPPRGWMIIMGGSLLVISLLLPLGMLGPARPDRLVADMPLDPFVLFLLPALLSGWRWIALIVMVAAPLGVAVVPRLLTRRDPAVIEIDEEACTGCELCVIDCPFDALSMQTLSIHDVPETGSVRGDEVRSIAVVEPDQCVACGICVGSCAFDAIDLPGLLADKQPAGDNEADESLAGRDVVVICDRHDQSDLDDPNAAVIAVRCAGVFAPNAVRSYSEQGATSVHLIGCAPADCRYGTGNTLAAERLAGSRAPHPARKFADRVASDFVASDEVAWARTHRSESSIKEPSDPRRYGAMGVAVLLSVGAIVAATSAPFRSADGARVRVVVDHVANAQLLEYDGAPGRIDRVELAADGVVLGQRGIPHDDSSSVGFADWEVPAGTTTIEVRGVVGTDLLTLAAGVFELGDREQLVLTATDVPSAPGSEDGRDVFNSRAAGCTVCHSTRQGRDGVGPTLYGVATVAAGRVEGLSAELYLRQSILLPDQHIVEGWPAGQMLPIYRERLDEQQLQALITYLLTLTVEESS